MLDTGTTDLPQAPRALGIGMPRFETPLVPRHSIAGRALVAVVAIMTFLASLTMGAVILIGGAASTWESDVAREVTIQVIPAPGRRRRRDGDESGRRRARLPRHRDRAALLARRNRPSCWSPGSAAASRSTNCRSRA